MIENAPPAKRVHSILRITVIVCLIISFVLAYVNCDMIVNALHKRISAMPEPQNTMREYPQYESEGLDMTYPLQSIVTSAKTSAPLRTRTVSDPLFQPLSAVTNSF